MILPVKAVPAQDNPKYSEWLIKQSPAKSIREDVFKYHKDLYWNKYRHIMEAEDRGGNP